MSTVTRPRGPLPARVYWTRRILLLLLALGLVFGIARLLGGSLGSETDPQAARTVGASDPDGTPAAPTATAGVPTAGVPTDAGAGAAQPAKPEKPKKALAEPEGPCDPADVRVAPRVNDAHAGSPVRIVLELTTRQSPACTFEVTPETVVLRLTSGVDPIWSSQQCPLAIPTESVVPRRKHADTVEVLWNARRSDDECTEATDWALPGWYHAESVAHGSVRPVDKQFELQGPVQVTRTAKPTPKPTPKPTQTAEAGDRDGEKRKKDVERRNGGRR